MDQSYQMQINNNEKKEDYFGKIGMGVILYAFVYTILLFHNPSGITMPIFTGVTVYFVGYCLKQFGKSWKKRSAFYIGAMFLLAVSDFTTGNIYVIIANKVVYTILLICLLLHNFYVIEQWSIGGFLIRIGQSIVGAISYIFEPFSDLSYYMKQDNRKEKSKMAPVLIGILIAVPLVFVVVSLLYFADAVFASMMKDLFHININAKNVAESILLFLFAFFSTYCGIKYIFDGRIKQEERTVKQHNPVIATTVLSIMSVIYLLFSGIQIVYLFGRKRSLPHGYTYAAYAREGFFQLLAVCIINVIMVLFILRFFKRRTGLNILMIITCLCTYIMTISSGYRMLLYISQYQMTRLRLLVLWALVVIDVLMIGILCMICKPEFGMVRFGMITVLLCYLVLSFSHMDYFIAQYNIHHAQTSDREMDLNYLSSLSSDAAPVICSYEQKAGVKDREWMNQYAHHLNEDTEDGIWQFNVSYWSARKLCNQQMKEEKDNYYIKLYNDTGEDIRNIGIKYYKDDNVIASGGMQNADGTEAVLKSMDHYEKGEIKYLMIFFSKEDLKHLGNGQQGVSVSLVFQGDKETTYETEMPYEIDLSTGEYQELYLMRDQGTYYLIN